MILLDSMMYFVLYTFSTELDAPLCLFFGGGIGGKSVTYTLGGRASTKKGGYVFLMTRFCLCCCGRIQILHSTHSQLMTDSAGDAIAL